MAFLEGDRSEVSEILPIDVRLDHALNDMPDEDCILVAWRLDKPPTETPKFLLLVGEITFLPILIYDHLEKDWIDTVSDVLVRYFDMNIGDLDIQRLGYEGFDVIHTSGDENAKLLGFTNVRLDKIQTLYEALDKHYAPKPLVD
jgi:hypothetical protein